MTSAYSRVIFYQSWSQTTKADWLTWAEKEFTERILVSFHNDGTPGEQDDTNAENATKNSANRHLNTAKVMPQLRALPSWTSVTSTWISDLLLLPLVISISPIRLHFPKIHSPEHLAISKLIYSRISCQMHALSTPLEF